MGEVVPNRSLFHSPDWHLIYSTKQGTITNNINNNNNDTTNNNNYNNTVAYKYEFRQFWGVRLYSNVFSHSITLHLNLR